MTKALNKRVIFVGGPTASGKTTVAIELAQWLNTEIISCDSRQFYRELKIGAAPPSPAELIMVKHHFVQNRSITKPLNAGQFEGEAMKKLTELFKVKNEVILVGGSGLFANALLFGFDKLPEANLNYRKELEELLATHGVAVLQEKLKVADPEYYAKVDVHNPHRLIRALEVIEASGSSFTELKNKTMQKRNFDVHILVLDLPREELYNRINKRVELMVEKGLEDEAKTLMPHQYLQPLNTVGYKEWFAHFNGEMERDKTIELIKQNTRRFAKRQLTWFRKYEDAMWVNPKNLEQIKFSLEPTG